MTRVAKTDQKKPGRKKGQKDQKPRKRKRTAFERSDASRRAAVTKKLNIERERGKQPAPTVSPYPKAGDNPEFVGLLDRMDLEDNQQSVSTQPGDSILSEKDIAEWIAWPFMTWAKYNDLPGLKLSDPEALSVAQPLSNILNRHGIGEVIPPDMLDGLKIAGRLTPIMMERFEKIKIERARRAGQGGPAEQTPAAGQGGPVTATDIKQGISITELKNPKV